MLSKAADDGQPDLSIFQLYNQPVVDDSEGGVRPEADDKS